MMRLQGVLNFAVTLLLLSAGSCQLVVPITNSFTIPTQTDPELDERAALSCGIVPNTTEIAVSWTTPNNGIVTAANVVTEAFRTKYRLQNGQVDSRFSDGTILRIERLSYLDSGSYTCSVMITGGPNAGQSDSAMIELSLLVELATTISTVSSFLGQDVSFVCNMGGYIRPDSDFLWRRGNDIITNSEKHNITYRSGFPGTARNGGFELVSSRQSTLIVKDFAESDVGNYSCFVQRTSAAQNLQVRIREGTAVTTGPANESTSTASPDSTQSTVGQQQGSSFPISAVAAIAAFLGFIVLVLIVLIVVVSLYKKRKSSAVVLDHLPERELNENTAYDSTTNGGALHGGGLPKYAKIDKPSISPPPPLPARPGTNLSSHSVMQEFDNSPPGYDVPLNNMTSSAEKSVTIDPYYDNPDDVKPPPPLPNPPKKKRTYYDEIEFGNDLVFSPSRDEHGYSVSGVATVPSPAAVLSGSLQRNAMNQPSPDFSYPPFTGELQGNAEHDYDQIYSEPLDPTMLRHEYELESNSDVAIPYSAIYEDPQPLHDDMPLRVTENNVVEIKRLGMGQFGNVILARTVGLSMRDLKFSEDNTDTNKSTLVAIKKLKNDADGGLMEVFEKEVKFMARLNHDNVIRLLAVCTTGENFIMMEYMENGDLNQFLQKQVLMPDTIAGLQENEVTPIILLYIGVQIASGMHYLGTHRFVHRDLATRNCLVGRDFIVKISDFGMSRSLYESAYYRVQGTLILPIRWMACETFYGKFSMKSDAWAFGVTLWEIYTLGKDDPYDTMTDEEVIADSIRGPDRKILERPTNCPPEVYEIMLRCWVHEPSMRADFGEIYSRLFMIYTRQAL